MKARYRFVLFAYPRRYRREHGAELEHTAVKLADGRWSGRQAGSLLLGGIRTRARLATGSSVVGAWASGARIALFMMLATSAGFGLAAAFGPVPDGVTYFGPVVLHLVPLVAVAAVVFTTRWPTALAVSAVHLVAMSSFVFGGHDFDMGLTAFWAVFMVAANIPLVVVAWWLAVRGDGRRAVPPTAGAVVVGVFAVVVAALGPDTAGAIIYIPLLVFVPLVGLVAAPIDPRPATAAVILWAIFAIRIAPIAWVNDDVGFNRWGPLILPLIGLAVGAAIAQASTQRHAQA